LEPEGNQLIVSSALIGSGRSLANHSAGVYVTRGLQGWVAERLKAPVLKCGGPALAPDKPASPVIDFPRFSGGNSCFCP